ncbi:hypothetical protein OQA88_5399 [Cercophora sp. LCS_1]
MAGLSRNILVVGATGKQGSATVRHLLAPTSPSDFHVWALTRDSTTPTAKRLQEDASKNGVADRLHLVDGNLEDPSRIRKVFDTIAASEGGLWGVFVAIAFPGLGVKDDRERDQGIMLANLALEFDVKAFVYSSALQPEPRPDQTPEHSRISKKKIENHCKSLTEKGLNWIILQPSFFMENLAGPIGGITITLFREGLKEDTALVLIASEDIGRVAAGVFANHELYLHKTVGLSSETLTTKQIMESFKRGTGKSMPTVPALLARLLLKLNADARTVLSDLENHQEARRDGSYASYEEDVKLGRSVCNLMSFEEWARKQADVAAAANSNSGWNKLSLARLLTGRV